MSDLFSQLQAMDDTPVERETYIRAPFPYVGCKTRSIATLLQHLPSSSTWIDGFGGSGAVTLARRKSTFEVFNDRHAGITSFYRCLRDRTTKDRLLERLDLTLHSREDFIWCVETWEHNELDDVERAARWYYLVSYSFAGVGRNFGRAKDGTKASIAGKLRDRLDRFEEIHERFKYIQVENLDWRLILRDYDSEDAVIYLDPPYYEKNVYKHNMTKDDHVELCRRIFDCKGFVALSGYANPLYDNFPWSRIEKWEAHVSVTTKAVDTDTSNVSRIGLNKAIECLWIKEQE